MCVYGRGNFGYVLYTTRRGYINLSHRPSLCFFFALLTERTHAALKSAHHSPWRTKQKQYPPQQIEQQKRVKKRSAFAKNENTRKVTYKNEIYARRLHAIANVFNTVGAGS